MDDRKLGHLFQKNDRMYPATGHGHHREGVVRILDNKIFYRK